MMLKNKKIVIRPFRLADQQAAQALILKGLGEHWGNIDTSLNPDLDDIAVNYADGIFLVACCEDQIIGTGALVPRGKTAAEIVRMSVAAAFRRQGIGTTILEALCTSGMKSGVKRIFLETTTQWQDVIAFYQRFGFQITHQKNSKFGQITYFSLDLPGE